MNYALEILQEELEDLEKVQAHCLRCGNQTDADVLELTKNKDLKAAIKYLEFIKHNENGQ